VQVTGLQPRVRPPIRRAWGAATGRYRTGLASPEKAFEPFAFHDDIDRFVALARISGLTTASPYVRDPNSAGRPAGAHVWHDIHPIGCHREIRGAD
jgi:hypothetical protein